MKFVSHAGKNVSHKNHKPAWLEAFFPELSHNGQYIALVLKLKPVYNRCFTTSTRH